MSDESSAAEDHQELGGASGQHEGPELTDLLRAWTSGSGRAREDLFEQVYPELRRLAGRRLARQPGEISLQATELVHEVYFRLIDQERVDWQNRSHFYAMAATMARRILVDQVKHRQRKKRGAGAVHVCLDDLELGKDGFRVELLALDAALTELAGIKMLALRVVELRFFSGLGVEETAQALGIGRTSVVRAWRFARAWLLQRLQGHHA